MGRPPKTIDWNIVEKKMEAGCNGIEIAGSLHISDDTFYIRFKEEYGKSFQDCSGLFHNGGKANLKFRQYAKAMEGSSQMLVWLGKQWLNQKDREEDKALSPNDASITQLLDGLNALKPKTNTELPASDAPL